MRRPLQSAALLVQLDRLLTTQMYSTYPSIMLRCGGSLPQREVGVVALTVARVAQNLPQPALEMWMTRSLRLQNPQPPTRLPCPSFMSCNCHRNLRVFCVPGMPLAVFDHLDGPARCYNHHPCLRTSFHHVEVINPRILRPSVAPNICQY